MYKVKYTKVALMEGGRTGNISMGHDILYTDLRISDIEKSLNERLLDSKRVAIVDEILSIGGHLLEK